MSQTLDIIVTHFKNIYRRGITVQILDLLNRPTNFHQKVLAETPLNMPK